MCNHPLSSHSLFFAPHADAKEGCAPVSDPDRAQGRAPQAPNWHDSLPFFMQRARELGFMMEIPLFVRKGGMGRGHGKGALLTHIFASPSRMRAKGVGKCIETGTGSPLSCMGDTRKGMGGNGKGRAHSLPGCTLAPLQSGARTGAARKRVNWPHSRLVHRP